MSKTPMLYQRLAQAVDAIKSCERSGNEEWRQFHKVTLATLANEFLPHGSGFDNGSFVDLDRSNATRLVISTAFHHMDADGYYDGWSEHEVIVTGSLLFDFELRVTGRNRNDIKEYIAETMRHALSREIDWQPAS